MWIPQIFRTLKHKPEKEFVTRLKQGYEDAWNTLKQDYSSRLYKDLIYHIELNRSISVMIDVKLLPYEVVMHNLAGPCKNTLSAIVSQL